MEFVRYFSISGRTCGESIWLQAKRGSHYTAPWKFTIPDEPKKKNITKTLEGIDLFAAAMDKHYGTN